MGLRRYQLFEFLDQSWLPDPFRSACTSYLTAAYATTPFPALWAAILVRVLGECRIDRIIDIGSGTGGPMEMVLKEMAALGCLPSVTLTDLFPVPTATSLNYRPQPVSATCVPPDLQGLRTLFATFHHFAPQEARAVLQDAFTQRQPICIFEPTSRTTTAIAVSAVIPVMVLLLTPSIRPVSMIQLFFTYLIPVLPVLIFWDGLVSQLRSYSLTELQELAADYRSPDYSWECGSIDAARIPFKTLYLVGRPLSV